MDTESKSTLSRIAHAVERQTALLPNVFAYFGAALGVWYDLTQVYALVARGDINPFFWYFGFIAPVPLFFLGAVFGTTIETLYQNRCGAGADLYDVKMRVGVVGLVSALLLLLALLPLPYGYYTVMRLFVSVSAVVLAQYGVRRKRYVVAGIFVGAALAFNPVVPMHLARATWVAVDLVAAAVYGLSGYLISETELL